MKSHLMAVALLMGLFLTACSNHQASNQTFEQQLKQNFCGEDFFKQNEEKIKKKDDVIYTGINTGSIARSCAQFEKSNFFFNAAEESYKTDVDLKNPVAKGAKVAVGALLNETLMDYDGSLYERIMVNVYKGLNYLELKEFDEARVEFNRALERQNKAKQYFAKQIQKDKEEQEKAKKDPNYKENMGKNTQTIMSEYDKMFSGEFKAQKNFTNPYATYLASIFFLLDKDYKKAADLFKEVAATHTNKEFASERKVFNSYAKSVKPDKLAKHIFVVYEDGFGAVKDEFSLTLPFVVSKNISSVPVALQTLKKRAPSYEKVFVNGEVTSQLTNFDDIVATEFKIEMPSMIAKALASTIIKTTLNTVVAEQADNDLVGGLLSVGTSAATSALTKADVRSWQSLPKTASVKMIKNTGKLEVKSHTGITLAQKELPKDKNVLVIVRSYSPDLEAKINIIEGR